MTPNAGARFLITGGCGFIGSHFVRHLYNDHPDISIVNVDALTYAGNPDNLSDIEEKERSSGSSRYVFIKGDICDAKFVRSIFSERAFDYIIHFAAESHVDRSIHEGAYECVRTNVLGTEIVLDACKDHPSLKKFVQVSTDEVYGSLPLSSEEKFTEHTPLSPNSPYASSKASADLIARSFSVTYGMPIVIVRASNNYGPHQHPEKFIPFSVLRLMEGKPITLYGDGKNVRDWTHVEDNCEAIYLAATKGKEGELYNISAEEELSNIELARLILAHFGKADTSLTFVKDRPGHDRRYATDASKIRRELGWKPMRSLHDSLEGTVAWYVHHTEWVKRALERAGKPNPHINA